MSDKKKIYPTQPDKDGYYYATPEEEEAKIQTKKYENGSATKTLTLSNGSVAVVRKLRGRDLMQTKRIMQNNDIADFETVNMAQAIQIDGKQQPPEYYLDDLFQKDYADLMIAFSALNFQ